MFYSTEHRSQYTLRIFPSVILILPTGGTAPSPSPSYRTSRLSYWHKPGLAPSFKVLSGASGPSEALPVAKIMYRGWSGMMGMRLVIEYCGENGDVVRIQEVKRVGWGREYPLALSGADEETSARHLIWKGTKSAVHRALGKGDGSKALSPSNGNLKLCSASDPNKVMALWENKTDYALLGNLIVYGDFEENTGLEDVVMSCLGIVGAERLSGRGWTGGLFKSADREKIFLNGSTPHWLLNL
ncbi:MAG: hypothetical protein M1836_008161 [Candelina mexicana]|nr:MAG: hypothetical protein M1836_008161 [Candelina mexicana]